MRRLCNKSLLDTREAGGLLMRRIRLIGQWKIFSLLMLPTTSNTMETGAVKEHSSFTNSVEALGYAMVRCSPSSLGASGEPPTHYVGDPLHASHLDLPARRSELTSGQFGSFHTDGVREAFHRLYGEGRFSAEGE